MAVVHLAIAQFRPRKGDVDGNIRRMGEILAQAAALDPAPHVVQFAETVPSGYFVEGAVRETAASGAANVGVAGQDGRGKIRQGMLEASNVNVVEELVDMIETQRAYEVNSKMISATDDMLKYVNQNL